MPDVTCWTLIESAADGDRAAREAFVERYLPVVRAYLSARWKERLSRTEIEDAEQEVFVECLKDAGILEKNRGRRGAGFRAYFFGAVRHIAQKVEEARARKLDAPQTDNFHADVLPADDGTSSSLFDRAWAAAIMREAAELQAKTARSAGPAALRRVELLRRLFQEGEKIADLAREWNVQAEALHRDYAKARVEFADALKSVVAFHVPESDAAVERECRDLMALLE